MTAIEDDHLQYWYEALVAKYKGDAETYSKEDFEKLLAKYQV